MGKTGGGRGTNQHAVKGRSAALTPEPAPAAASDVRAAAVPDQGSCSCGGPLAARDDNFECVNVACDESPYRRMDACEDCGAPVEHDIDGSTHAAGNGIDTAEDLEDDHHAFVTPIFEVSTTAVRDAAVLAELRAGGDAGMSVMERQMFLQGR